MIIIHSEKYFWKNKMIGVPTYVVYTLKNVRKPFINLKESSFAAARIDGSNRFIVMRSDYSWRAGRRQRLAIE